jgi:8-oxo-dGTP pyrophosphatase MutT (NUDIX family)
MSFRISLEPVITPLFRAWWRLSRGTTLGVRGIACDKDGHVLLIRHSYKAGWHLPGGGVESGEHAIESMTREMAEEAGVEAATVPVLLGFYANHASFKNDHILLYKIESWRPCKPLDNGEIAEIGFFDMNALPHDVTRGTQRRLAEVFAGAPQSPHW